MNKKAKKGEKIAKIKTQKAVAALPTFTLQLINLKIAKKLVLCKKVLKNREFVIKFDELAKFPHLSLLGMAQC